MSVPPLQSLPLQQRTPDKERTTSARRKSEVSLLAAAAAASTAAAAANAAAPLATAGEAVEIHRRMAADVRARLDELQRASRDVAEGCHRLAAAYRDYADVLTNESEPEVATAKKGALKLVDFLERIDQIFVEAIGEVEKGAAEPYRKLLETTVEEAHESVRRVERTQAAYDAARKHSSETVAKRKASTAASKMKEAQDEQEAARNAFVKAEKEALAAHAIACNAAYIMMPRSFAALYGAVSKAAEQCTTLAADMEPYSVEFQRAAREFEITDSGSAEKATENARKEALQELVELEQQYLVLLRALGEIRTRVGAERTTLKITEEDIGHVFNKTAQITTLHVEMLSKLQDAAMAPAATAATTAASEGSPPSPSQLAAEAVAEQIPTMEELYVQYIENQTRAASLVEALKKSKHFTSLMRGFEQQCALAGMPVFDFMTMLSTPCRHVAKIRTHLQRIMDNTPTTERGWNALHDTLERMGELLDKFDEARKQSEHIKQLLHVKERLPDEDIVDGARIFLFDSGVTAIGQFIMPPIGPPSQMQQSSPALPPPPMSPPGLPPAPHGLMRTSSTLARHASTPPMPLSARSPDSSNSALTPRASSQQLPDIIAGKHYHLFLFSDLLIVARTHKHKSSSEQATFKAVMRLPVQALGVADLGDKEQGKFAFRVDYPQGALRLAATSVEHREVWVNTLSRAITDRKKTQVFGVPLGEIMRRPSERNHEVPQILEVAAAFIERAGLEVEGIFRLSSSSTEVARLQCRIDSGRPIKFTEIHNTTGILKAWLRAMPAPLLTFELYNDWIDAANDVSKLKMCVSRMPRVNRHVLAALIGLLNKVSKYSEKNMMDAHNLAIVFAPNILYQRGGSDILASSDTTYVISTLIASYEEVFSETIEEQNAMRAGASAKKSEATQNRRERLRRLASKKEIIAPVDIAPPPLLTIPPPSTPPPPVAPTAPKPSSSPAPGAGDIAAAASASGSATLAIADSFHIAPPMSESSARQFVHTGMTVIPPPSSEGSASGTEHATERGSGSVGSLQDLPDIGPPPIPPPPLAVETTAAAAPAEDGGEGPEHRRKTKHRHTKRASGSDLLSSSTGEDPSPVAAEKPSTSRKTRATNSLRHTRHRHSSIGDANEGSQRGGSTPSSTDKSDASAATPTLALDTDTFAVVSPLDTLPTVSVDASTFDMESLPESHVASTSASAAFSEHEDKSPAEHSESPLPATEHKEEEEEEDKDVAVIDQPQPQPQPQTTTTDANTADSAQPADTEETKPDAAQEKPEEQPSVSPEEKEPPKEVEQSTEAAAAAVAPEACATTDAPGN